MLGRLMPREGKFFDLFNAHAERIVEVYARDEEEGDGLARLALDFLLLLPEPARLPG